MKFAIRSFFLMLIPLIAGCGGCGGVEAEIKAKNEAAKNMTAKEAAESFKKAMADVDVTTMWSHLPDSWQKDINDVAQLAASKMDKELWDKGFTVVSKFNQVLKEKSDFILNSKMTKGIPGKLDKNALDAIANLIATISDSDLKDLEKCKTMDVGVYLGKTLPDLKKRTDELAKAFPDLQKKLDENEKEVTFEVLKEEGDKATLKTTTDGKEKNVEFVRVEGKWVPEDMNKEFPGGIEEAKKGIEGLTEEKMKAAKDQMMPVLKNAEAALDKILAAATQEEFDQELAKLAMQIGPMLMGRRGGGPPVKGPAFPPMK